MLNSATDCHETLIINKADNESLFSEVYFKNVTLVN